MTRNQMLVAFGCSWILFGVLYVVLVQVTSMFQPAGADADGATAIESVSIEDLEVIDERPFAPGYDRSCKAGDACSFGPAWTDNTEAPKGHNGCDTRNDVLLEQLSAVDVGRDGCTVTRGHLVDPYTGDELDYSPGADVEVDHVIPLVLVWDLGASEWTTQQRTDFANDPLNLLVTSTEINQDKFGHTPSEWSPPTLDGRCTYAQHFIATATKYELSVPEADVTALDAMLSDCR